MELSRGEISREPSRAFYNLILFDVKNLKKFKEASEVYKNNMNIWSLHVEQSKVSFCLETIPNF